MADTNNVNNVILTLIATMIAAFGVFKYIRKLHIAGCINYERDSIGDIENPVRPTVHIVQERLPPPLDIRKHNSLPHNAKLSPVKSARVDPNIAVELSQATPRTKMKMLQILTR